MLSITQIKAAEILHKAKKDRNWSKDNIRYNNAADQNYFSRFLRKTFTQNPNCWTKPYCLALFIYTMETRIVKTQF